MAKSHLAMALLVTVAATPLRAENKVQTYIAGIRSLIVKYQKAIAGQIAENRKQYREILAVAEDGRRKMEETELRFERTRRAERLANDYAEKRRPVSQWKDDLLAYAQLDYQVNRELLRQEFTDGSAELAGLENLRVEQTKLEALDTILAGLAKPESFLQQAEAVGKFAAAAKAGFDAKVCEGTKTDLAAKEKAAAALLAAVTELKAKPQDDAVKKALEEKEKELKNATAAVKAVKDFRAGKKCP